MTTTIPPAERGLAAALTRAFGSEDAARPWRRVERMVSWIRLAIFASVLIVGTLDVSEIRPHRVALLVLLLVYSPVVVGFAFRASRRPAGRLAALCLDLTLLFLLQLFVPETRFVALFGYVLLQSYAGAGGGLVAGLTVGIVGLTLGVVGERFDPVPGFDTFTLSIYGVVLLSNAFLIEAATREHLFRHQRASQEEMSSLSHELKNSLTAIEGLTSTLYQRWTDLDDGTRRALLERVRANSSELEELTSNVLDAARRGETWEPQLRSLDVTEFIRRFVDAHRPVFAEHPIHLNLPSRLDVRADEFALARILGNLLSNAAKYSPSSSPIEIAAAAGGDEITLSVSDHGRGISEDDRARIFDAFFRGEGIRLAPGTGLGLGVVRRYVSALGGRVWFESEQGEGTTFYFTLPSAAVEKRAG